jgi:thiamine-phosphate pyrophosphorylase
VRLLLYYITDRMQLPGEEQSRRRELLRCVDAAARAGIDYIQLRERDLTGRELLSLAEEVVETVRSAETRTKLLINSRIDVAIASGADGVHLRSNDLKASEARAVWTKSQKRSDCVIAQSCHTLMDVMSAEGHGADFVVFGPVFGKQGNDTPATGIEGIQRITRRGTAPDPKVEAGQSLRMPVIALGGVTIENAAACLRAGAAGVAGIRLFQRGDVAETARRLRALA